MKWETALFMEPQDHLVTSERIIGVYGESLCFTLQFRDLQPLNLWCGVLRAKWPTCQSNGPQDIKQWRQRDSRSTPSLAVFVLVNGH